MPFSQVVAAARGAAWWTVPAVLASVTAIYVFDSFAIWKMFGWFLTRCRSRRSCSCGVRPICSPPINYSVGQGAIVYFVHRAAGVPVVRGVGTVLLIMGVNVLALCSWPRRGWRSRPTVPRSLYVVITVA